MLSTFSRYPTTKKVKERLSIVFKGTPTIRHFKNKVRALRNSLSGRTYLRTPPRLDRTDTQRGVLPGVVPESAICVQRFDDSLNSAIRITYRISLRSSSVREPRHPLLRVVLYVKLYVNNQCSSEQMINLVCKKRVR